MSLENELPDIALANVALENLNEKGEAKIKSVMGDITNNLQASITNNYNTLNDKIINDIDVLNADLSSKITNLSESTTQSLSTKANNSLSNLTDAGNTVIDSRIMSIMNSKIKSYAPNYNSLINISSNYTAPSDGIIYMGVVQGTRWIQGSLAGHNIVFCTTQGTANITEITSTFIVKKGNVMSFSKRQSPSFMVFVPYG